MISPFYEADKSVNNVQKEIQLKVIPIIDTIHNDSTITWEEVSSISAYFNKPDSLPHKKLREDIKSQHQSLLSDLSNQSNYPMTGKMYKSKIINIIDILNDAIQVYNRSSTSEFEILLVEQIRKVKNEMEVLTSLYRNDNKNDLSFLSVSLKGLFLIAGGFVYHLNNGSTITLTFFPEVGTAMTHFIFCEQKKHGSISRYLNHLNIMADIELRHAISDIILSVGGNVFLSPLYYEQLDKEIQTLLLKTKTEIIQKRGFNLF